MKKYFKTGVMIHSSNLHQFGLTPSNGDGWYMSHVGYIDEKRELDPFSCVRLDVAIPQNETRGLFDVPPVSVQDNEPKFYDLPISNDTIGRRAQWERIRRVNNINNEVI